MTEPRFLGKKSEFRYTNPHKELLDPIEDKTIDNTLVVLDTREFTSLCPITGQPDFGEIQIFYIPNKLLVESKSLKLYLGAFRNEGTFHEECVSKICSDLNDILEPLWIRVIGKFNARGGISINAISEKQQPDYEVPKQYLTLCL